VQLIPAGPIETAHLFAPLHDELLALLSRLAPEDWERPTIAGSWRVRDVAAHILDTSLRRLSVQRDGYSLPPEDPIAGYRDLVGHLNRLNAEWIRVARRFSPRVLVELLEVSGPAVARLVESLPPEGDAIFSVAWAGDESSRNWFDVGREYTEWWHHQAQIRDAVGAPPLDAARWLRPVIELSMYALPVAFVGIDLPEESPVAVRVSGDAGGAWSLLRTGPGWKLFRGAADRPALLAAMDADAAWRLFFNALSEDAARKRIVFEGNAALAERFLAARGVMV
jgi:uncharacterized protein (TIGR03083 family)